MNIWKRVIVWTDLSNWNGLIWTSCVVTPPRHGRSKSTVIIFWWYVQHHYNVAAFPFVHSSNPTMFWMAVVHLTLTSLVLFAVGAIAWLDCRHDPDWQELCTGHRPADRPASSRPTASSSVTISMTTFVPDPQSSTVGHRLTPGPSLIVWNLVATRGGGHSRYAFIRSSGTLADAGDFASERFHCFSYFLFIFFELYHNICIIGISFFFFSTRCPIVHVRNNRVLCPNVVHGNPKGKQKKKTENNIVRKKSELD